MKQLFINTVKSFGYPVKLQGSIGKKGKYPESFFTFWNNDTTGSSYYDNTENNVVWDFDLNFYSTNPDLVNGVLPEAKKKLKEHGFVVSGKGYDVASDEPTHTGRGINVLAIEKQEVKNDE